MYAADLNICYNLIGTESSLSITSQISVLLNLFLPNHGSFRTVLSLGGIASSSVAINCPERLHSQKNSYRFV